MSQPRTTSRPRSGRCEPTPTVDSTLSTDAEFVRVRGEMDLGFARLLRVMVYGFTATIVANAGVVAAIVGAGS